MFPGAIFRHKLRCCVEKKFQRWKLHPRNGIPLKSSRPLLPIHAMQATERATPGPPFRAETICDSPNVHQPGANGVDYQLGSLVNAERIHNIRAVNRNRVGA